MYQNASAQNQQAGDQPGPSGAADAPSDDEVADAEIVDDDQQTA